MSRAAATRRARAALGLSIVVLASGCSIQRLAVDALGNALAESGEVYARDPDPALVGEALPFALKTIETLLAENPDHQGLLLAAARGFPQYAYGWVQLPADYAEDESLARAQALRERALGLYLRGRDYGVRGLEVAHSGLEERLRSDPHAAVAAVGGESLDLLYWTGAAWGAAISLGADRPELVADLEAVRALLGRVLELDETYDRGAVHEAFIRLAAVPAAMGGSLERATEHYERAVEIAGDVKASPHVTYAETVAVRRQDRDAFHAVLDRALEIDPDAVPELTLANLLVQERARWLRERADELFLAAPSNAAPSDEGDETEPRTGDPS